MDTQFKRKFIEARKEVAKNICLERGWPLNFSKMSREDIKKLWEEKRWKFPKIYNDFKFEWGGASGSAKGLFGDIFLFEIETDLNLEILDEKELSVLLDPEVSLELDSSKETLSIIFNDLMVIRLSYLNNTERKRIQTVYENKLKELLNLNYEKIYA